MPSATPMRFPSVRLATQAPGASAPAEERTVAVTVEPSGLSILDAGGRTRFLDFDGVERFVVPPYRLELVGLDGAVNAFSQLGYEYEAFLHQVASAWNAYVSDAMFVDEPCLIEAKGDFAYDAPANPLLGLPAVRESSDRGDALFRLYPSSLLVLPFRSPVRRIPLCFVKDLRRDGYRFTVEADTGERLVLARLGHDTDPMEKALRDAVATQTQRAFELLREVVGLVEPAEGAPPLAPLPEHGLMEAAWHLREGRATALPTLESACPGLPARLDRLLRQWSSAGYYEALLGLARETGSPGLSLGIRREQPTDAAATEEEAEGEAAAPDRATARYATDGPVGAEPPPDAMPIPAFWLALPLPGPRPAVVVEAVAGAPLAQATYVFDLGPDPAAWSAYAAVLGQGLEAVDFRRQPVYLPLETLQQPAYRRDLAALRFCPPLAFLRRSFRRRTFHTDPAKWGAALRKALMDGPKG